MAKRILITDDQREFVEVMKTRFEKEGYEIATAYDGEECLKKVKAEPPDLIIMDITMPKMDGYTVVRGIKADEKIKDIPIIILTGRDQMEDIFKMEGVKEYVVKPFEYEDLLEKIKKIFDDSV